MNWFADRWPDIGIPLLVFLASLIVIFWLRSRAYKALALWTRKTPWQGDEMMLAATRGPSLLWCLLLSAYVSLAVSAISAPWKARTTNGLWTLLLLSLTPTAANLANQVIVFYGERLKAPRRGIVLASRGARAAILAVAILILLDIWGVPISPILLLIALVFLALALLVRGAMPDLFAGFQLSAFEKIKVGDYVRLETGEEGYVRQIDWTNTRIEALDKSIVSIPNRRFVEGMVINYGHPLKVASDPFRFATRSHLKELTGLKAANLRELAGILKEAPDSVVYYHTHSFLEEHHYLTPEPASDFAVWVSDALGDEVLGEKLAAIDTFEFSSLGALRARLVNIIEEHLALEATEAHVHRDALEGREFRFIKSVSVILPLPYVAYDLREFVEVLRKLSLGSLYFHIFESRLRLAKGTNDFSVWLEDGLGEKEIAEEIAHLDPYNFTLEELRSELIQLIEKRIK